MFCLGGFCPGGFWQGGFLSRGFLSGGLCPGGFCPRTTVVVCSHLSLQHPVSHNVSPLQPSHRSATFKSLNFHCRRIVTWHLLASNSKLVGNFQQTASTRCNDDYKKNYLQVFAAGLPVISTRTRNPSLP